MALVQLYSKQTNTHERERECKQSVLCECGREKRKGRYITRDHMKLFTCYKAAGVLAYLGLNVTA